MLCVQSIVDDTIHPQVYKYIMYCIIHRISCTQIKNLIAQIDSMHKLLLLLMKEKKNNRKLYTVQLALFKLSFLAQYGR